MFAQEQRNFILLTFDETYFNSLPAGRALLLSPEELARFTFATLQAWYKNLCAEHDLVIVDNFNLSEDAKPLVFMGMADQNICVVDTRKTHLKRIAELNLMEAKNNIPNLSIALNNHKYSPSLAHEGWWLIKNAYKSITRS